MNANFWGLRPARLSKQQIKEWYEPYPVKKHRQQKRPDQMAHYFSSVAIRKSLSPNLRNSSRAATT